MYFSLLIQIFNCKIIICAIMKKKTFVEWEKQQVNKQQKEIIKKPSKLMNSNIQILRNQQKVAQQLKNLANEIFDGKYEPQKLQFRQKQYQQINEFIDKSLQNQYQFRCLLLTGMPGSGKTSLCTKILSQKKIKSIKLNANVFKNLKQLLSLLSVQIFNRQLKKATLQQFMALLQKYNKIEKTVIMIDQVDTLFKYEDSNAVQFFNIFKKPHQNLILIGISNSMEMLYSIGQKYNLQLPSLKNIVFSPYTIDQTQKIIVLRLQELYKKSNIRISFDQRSLKYSSSKIYNAKGGDLRNIIQYVKKILDQVLNKQKSYKQNTQIKIKLQDAINVLKLLNTKSRNTLIMISLPFHQQIIMMSIYNLFKKDCLDVTIKQIYKQVSWLNSSLGLQPISMNQINQTTGFLQSYGFLIIKQKKNTKKQKKFIPKISINQIQDAYFEHPLLKRFFQKQQE